MASNGSLLTSGHVEARHFRRVCSRFACGITIATVLDAEGNKHGMTASSFASVSLSPPIVLLCVDHRCNILEHFRRGTHFGINILGESHRHLSNRFASSVGDRFEGVEWYAGQSGVPLLPGVLATIECVRLNLVPAGDHDILIGEVLHAHCQDGEPLIQFGSQYRYLGQTGKPDSRSESGDGDRRE
jgi:flavin reductase ActVB